MKLVNDKNLSPDDEATVDAKAFAKFPSADGEALTPGMYMVIGAKFRMDGKIYYPLPVIISLPTQNEANEWVYDVYTNAKYTIGDDMPINLIVEKKWDDAGHTDKRPAEITVILLKNGKEAERTELNEDNDWTHRWEDLDPIYDWTVSEVEFAEYTPDYFPAEIDDNEWTYVIKNTYRPPKLPQTGQLNWPIPILLASGIMLMAHNYPTHFGRLNDLSEGSEIIFTDMDGNIWQYQVVVKDVLNPEDVEEMVAGEYDLTLFTCTRGGSYRVTLRCDKIHS